MKLQIENDFQQKIMRMSFAEKYKIAKARDVLIWRQEWMNALKTWHSPYKTMIDGTLLEFDENVDLAVKDEFLRMQKFLEGLFLRKAVMFGCKSPVALNLIPFEIAASEEEAATLLGIRQRERVVGAVTNFRDAMLIENHFRQHVVELSFSQKVAMESQSEIDALRSKLTNNLMQWHSKWSLLIDCTNLEFKNEARPGFEKLEKYFRGFFLKQVIGYGVTENPAVFPFPIFRSRHKAAAELEGEGNFAGDEADCKSRK